MIGGDLQRLKEALEDVRQVPLSCLPAVEIAERAVELERLATQLEAIRCATLAAASDATDAPGAFKALGHRHAIGFIADETRGDARGLRRLDRTGRWLIDFPILAGAFAAGELSHRHVTELRGLDKPKHHHQLVEAQDYLLNAAVSLSFPEFVNVCAYWLNAADPDGQEPIVEATRTGCSYTKHADGTITGKFRFDPLSGQAFRTLLDTETQRLFRQDHEDGVARSEGSRRGTALLNLMVRGADRGGNSQITPLIHVVMGQDLAENLVARLAGHEDMAPMEPSFTNLDRRCELIDGTPVHPNLVMIAMATAIFRRVVFDHKSKAIEVADNGRGFPTWMKHVLLIKARGRCQIPACDAPFPWLQADHVKPHSKGGLTKLSNGQILCEPHNKWKRDDAA